jgi:hypothetical protein
MTAYREAERSLRAYNHVRCVPCWRVVIALLGFRL